MKEKTPTSSNQNTEGFNCIQKWDCGFCKFKRTNKKLVIKTLIFFFFNIKKKYKINYYVV